MFLGRQVFHRIGPRQRLFGGSDQGPQDGLGTSVDEILRDELAIELDGDFAVGFVGSPLGRRVPPGPRVIIRPAKCRTSALPWGHLLRFEMPL